MANTFGKAYAYNVLTPMKRWKAVIAWLVLRFATWFRPKEKELRMLSFIHFASWTILWPKDFKRIERRANLAHAYLLFCSNFTGTWDEYVEAFSSAIPAEVNILFRWSEKYPGSVPTEPLKQWSRNNQFDTEYYWNAYPDASIIDVRAALHLRDCFDSFLVESIGLTDDEFSTAYARFISLIQQDLRFPG
jgi:hypothetical protein